MYQDIDAMWEADTAREWEKICEIQEIEYDRRQKYENLKAPLLNALCNLDEALDCIDEIAQNLTDASNELAKHEWHHDDGDKMQKELIASAAHTRVKIIQMQELVNKEINHIEAEEEF